MIRTTAEASSTSLAVLCTAISARAILTDQFFWARLEDRSSGLKCECLEIGKRLPASLAGIASTGLLEITERLLVQAAMVLAGSELQHLVDRIRKIADV